MNKHLKLFEIPSGDSKIPLLNIVSGHVADESTEEQVLDPKWIGQEATMTNIQERLVERTVSYWDPITKLNLATFSSDVKLIKASTKKIEKTKTLKYHQDLLSRLLTVGRSRYIDFKNVLPYKLVPVPIALFHPTGEMRATNKTGILKKFEINSSSYGNRQEICMNKFILVIDFIAVLQALSK